MRLAVVTIACAFALAPLARAADSIPADWVDVQAGPMFTVKAPPGTIFERIRTGDAFAGNFHGAGFELAVEFGYHRETRKDPDGVANMHADAVTIDAKPGTIVTASRSEAAHPYFVGLHVPSVETDTFGPLSLVITGAADKPDSEQIVERIYRSISFGYKN